MAESKGIRALSWFDCTGGGQVVVNGNYAYIGHQQWPVGTTIVDVRDPRNPKRVAEIGPLPDYTHSHKVRSVGDLMVVNYEPMNHMGPAPKDFDYGLGIYDTSNPAAPKKIAHYSCRGVHRFTFDGRYVYFSPQLEGFIGNIVMILDLKNPSRPEEVGRWWMPGQWKAGGETPTWEGTGEFIPRCHHPIRLGDRLYVSYWHGGWHILDIADMTKPKQVSSMNWSPPFPWPTHTCLPIPFAVRGRKIMIVADEDASVLYPAPGSFLWIVDITDETRPVPFASYQLDEVDDTPTPIHTGVHQPAEDVKGTEIPIAWHVHGMRLVDIANPHRPRETAHFVPDVPPGTKRVQTNDVCWDERGLIYIVDRVRGMHILERT